MKTPLIALAIATALAACGEPQGPAKTSAATPVPENTAIPPQGVTASKDTASAPAASPQASASPASGSDGAPATDSEMSSKIKQELAANGNVPADGIEVAAADGVVTLTGSVNQAEEKERAAMFVIGLEGVRSVVNNLTVRGS